MEGNQKQPRRAMVMAWILVIGVSIGVFGIVWMIILQLMSFVSMVRHLTPEQWDGILNVTSKTSGIAAILAALGTITAMMITNKSRAREAASANFRDHIQWAVEKVSSDNQFEVAFAQAVIQHFAKNRPKSLSKKEHELVLEVQETLEKMYILTDSPSVRVEPDGIGSSSGGTV